MTTITKNNTIKLSHISKEVLPHCIVIVGGAYPTVYPKKLISQSSAIDIEVVGEGEQTVVELTRIIGDGRDLNDVHGIIYRDNAENIIQTAHILTKFSALNLSRKSSRTLASISIFMCTQKK